MPDDSPRAYSPSRRATGLLLAWLLLDTSMAVYLGLNGPSTISRVVLASGVLLLLVTLVRRPPANVAPSVSLVEGALTALLALELVARIVVPYRPEQPAPTIPVPALAVIALVALVSLVAVRARPTRFSIANAAIGLVLIAALAARWTIVAWDIEPGFDVHLIQDAAGRAILAGENPYSVPTAYHSGYPYWPLSALLAAAGLLAGDARWALLVADLVTVLAFAMIARNIGAPARLGFVAAALILWNVSGLYMTWQSLPEPALIAAAAMAVALLTRPRARGFLAGLALGIAIGLKQLGLGLVPLLPLSRRRPHWNAFAAAGVASGTIVLTFLALAPEAFLRGTVSSHLSEPARDYAINLLDPLPGIVPRFNVPFVVTAILALGIGLAVRLRWPDSIDGWLAGTIALFTVAFSLIGISFLNYYQIPLALLLILILLPSGWNPDGWNPEPGTTRAA